MIEVSAMILNSPVVLSAWVVELVDTRDLKSLAPCGRAGSIPALGTSLLGYKFLVFALWGDFVPHLSPILGGDE